MQREGKFKQSNFDEKGTHMLRLAIILLIISLGDRRVKIYQKLV
jgi:hypothetical protein